MYVRNNTGAMPLPWTTPLSKLDSVDRASPTLIWCERPWNNSSTAKHYHEHHTNIDGLKAFRATHCQILCWNRYTRLLQTSYFVQLIYVQSFNASSKLVHVDRPLTNPCCVQDKRLLSSWVMSSDISHRIPLTMRLQPLRMRRITWPMRWGKFFPYLKSPTPISLFTIQLLWRHD